ncbi:MAG: hypothetical protein WHU94_07090 [Thermogemmata sp.]|uniref:Uncharacterized protein n=1 Tax=Thermogemmata fonticola TaxID=2755323 RepID=A0A7V8VFY1_9BACT|nr:hypothetical protein [Thermogemmata fonticola]MBA2227329.1 hypothetical protein [Thermogemmata fonticola]
MVSKRAALAVAVETFYEAGPALPWATSDAQAFLRTLSKCGYPSSHTRLWTAHHTTCAALASHLRRLGTSWENVEEIVILWITRTWTSSGKTFLACADTLRDDPAATALPFAEVFRLVEQAAPNARRLTWLCDFSPLPIPKAHGQGGWSERELARIATGKHVILTAAAEEEESWTSVSLQQGIWRHHLREAFEGRAAEALDSAGRLTAAGLHRYLAYAVPRTLRKTHEADRQQTPLCFPPLTPEGEAVLSQHVLAAFTPGQANPAEWLSPSRLQRVIFRSEIAGRLKDLSGFRKSYTVPERANESARKFVQRIGHSDLKADLDQMYERIREQFGYKRKEMEAVCETTGSGTIRTPDFEYTVLLELDESNPSQVIWRREVGQLSSVELVRQAAFRQVFGAVLDRLVFEFREPLDVAAYVDRWESEAPPGTKVRVNSEATQAEITLSGVAGRICVTATSVTIFGRPGDPTTLLEQFLAFLGKYLASNKSQRE